MTKYVSKMALDDNNNNNYMKFIVKDRNVTNDKCRSCNQTSETIQHITKLAHTEYLHRHNCVCTS